MSRQPLPHSQAWVTASWKTGKVLKFGPQRRTFLSSEYRVVKSKQTNKHLWHANKCIILFWTFFLPFHVSPALAAQSSVDHSILKVRKSVKIWTKKKDIFIFEIYSCEKPLLKISTFLRYKPDYLATFFGFFHMWDLGFPFTFHFRIKNTESSIIFLWNVVLILNWKENN